MGRGRTCRDLTHRPRHSFAGFTEGRTGTAEQAWFLGDSGASSRGCRRHTPPQPSGMPGAGPHSWGHRGDSGRGESPVCSPNTGRGPGRGAAGAHGWQSPRDVQEGSVSAPAAGSTPLSSLPVLSHLAFTPRPPRNHLGFLFCPVRVISLFYEKTPTSWLQPLRWASSPAFS